MSQHFIFGPSEIYFATAAILIVGTMVLLGFSVRESGHTRKMLLVATVPAASMTIAYVLMGLELFTVEVTAVGRQQSMARFFGYTFVLGAFVYLEKELIDISWRQFGIVYGLLLLTPWASLVSWVTRGSLESGMSALAVVAYLIGAYVLFGPHTRHAQTSSGERRLLFAKMRNLFVLSLGALILQSAISEQSLGLTDFFVGQIGASYTDLIFLLGIGGLAVSGRAVFEDTEDSKEGKQQEPATDSHGSAAAADS